MPRVFSSSMFVALWHHVCFHDKFKGAESENVPGQCQMLGAGTMPSAKNATPGFAP
jgi:hypothetical protein